MSVDEAFEATDAVSLDWDVVVTKDDSAEFIVCEGTDGVLGPRIFFFGGGFLLTGVKSTSCKHKYTSMYYAII